MGQNLAADSLYMSRVIYIHSLVLGVRPALLRIFSFYIKADMYLPSVTQSNIIDVQLLLLRYTVENPAETG